MKSKRECMKAAKKEITRIFNESMKRVKVDVVGGGFSVRVPCQLESIMDEITKLEGKNFIDKRYIPKGK